MERKSLKELARLAKIGPAIGRRKPMSRQERLARWAQVLEQERERVLNTLYETEFQPRRVRDCLRSENSPLSVAFEDPVLRTDGLTGDSYGEARAFFDLSDLELHAIVCYCHHGLTMTADEAARRVRLVMGNRLRPAFHVRVTDAWMR